MDRKEIIREYKERKIPRGVFAMRCTATGQVWVNSAMNLDAAKNRLWFSLRNGSERNQALLQEWNTHGEPAFEFEILEKLKDDVSPLELSDLLKEKKLHWIQRLGAAHL